MDSQETKINDLPEEILEMIFGFLPWSSLQKSCTVVSKKWFNLIRNNQNLSGDLRLGERKEEGWKNTDIIDFLERNWPKVRNVYLGVHLNHNLKI